MIILKGLVIFTAIITVVCIIQFVRVMIAGVPDELL